MIHFTISQWGLIFIIIGVLFSFRYGLPSKITEHPEDSLSMETGKNEWQRIKDHNKARKGAFIGLAIVFIGFLLQFIGISKGF
jgi:uncharacterized ion transporter superfamily protein YfcC